MLALLRPKHKCVDILFGFQWPAYEWSGEKEKTDWVRDGKFKKKQNGKLVQITWILWRDVEYTFRGNRSKLIEPENVLTEWWF